MYHTCIIIFRSIYYCFFHTPLYPHLFKCNAHGLIPLNGLNVNRFTRSESRRLGNHEAISCALLSQILSVYSLSMVVMLCVFTSALPQARYTLSLLHRALPRHQARYTLLLLHCALPRHPASSESSHNISVCVRARLTG